MSVAKVMKKDIEKNMAINKMLKWNNIYINININMIQPKKLI